MRLEGTPWSTFLPVFKWGAEGCARPLLRWPLSNTRPLPVYISQGSFSDPDHRDTRTSYITCWTFSAGRLPVCADCTKANKEQPRLLSLGGRGRGRKMKQYGLLGVSSCHLQEINPSRAIGHIQENQEQNEHCVFVQVCHPEAKTKRLSFCPSCSTTSCWPPIPPLSFPDFPFTPFFHSMTFSPFFVSTPLPEKWVLKRVHSATFTAVWVVSPVHGSMLVSHVVTSQDRGQGPRRHLLFLEPPLSAFLIGKQCRHHTQWRAVANKKE